MNVVVKIFYQRERYVSQNYPNPTLNIRLITSFDSVIKYSLFFIQVIMLELFPSAEEIPKKFSSELATLVTLNNIAGNSPNLNLIENLLAIFIIQHLDIRQLRIETKRFLFYTSYKSKNYFH